MALGKIYKIGLVRKFIVHIFQKSLLIHDVKVIQVIFDLWKWSKGLNCGVQHQRLLARPDDGEGAGRNRGEHCQDANWLTGSVLLYFFWIRISMIDPNKLVEIPWLRIWLRWLLSKCTKLWRVNSYAVMIQITTGRSYVRIICPHMNVFHQPTVPNLIKSQS